MRAAPAVAVRCTGGAAWRLLRTLLPALAAAVFVAWLFLHAEWPASRAWLAAAVVGGVVAAMGWWRTAPRTAALAWDGQQWTVDGVVGRLAVMIDIGPVLLRLQPGTGGARAARWLAVTAADAGAQWGALRAALYSYSRPPDSATPRRPADPHG